MASKGEGEISDLRSLQRERERERRRLRDRQRRQNMNQEQRERHLARRRRNYQLRRMRAENAKLNAQQTPTLPTPAVSQQNMVYLTVYNNTGNVNFGGQQTMATLGSTLQGGEGGMQRPRKFPKRLRLCQIRHLARSLHAPPNDQSRVADTNSSKNCGGTKRVRLTHVKRLARALKSDKQ